MNRDVFAVDDDDNDILNYCVGHVVEKDVRFEDIDVSAEMGESIEERIFTSNSKAVVEASRPTMEMDLPYRCMIFLYFVFLSVYRDFDIIFCRTYKLVRANGIPIERIEKHAFCMARVVYNNTEIQEDVWFEPSEGTHRWQQSAGELRILVLCVEAGTKASDIQVDILSHSVKVSNFSSGAVYLEVRVP
jgi:hypothetical protein|tara:strand:- start:17905 stop:18471 length:567 start_codon:yes stop_codon:yes gene_type:complete